jgi:hypothetical protein
MDKYTLNPVSSWAPEHEPTCSKVREPARLIGWIQLDGARDVPVQIEDSRLLNDIEDALEVDLDCAIAVVKCLAHLLAKKDSSTLFVSARRLTVWQQRKVEKFID